MSAPSQKPNQKPDLTAVPNDDEARASEIKQERQALFAEMEELKNVQIRRKVEEMRASEEAARKKKAEAEKKAQAAAARAATDAGPAKTGLQPAGPARVRPRHLTAALGFAVLVVAPVAASAWYLWDRAHDRYASIAGFSVRTEEISSALDLLGGIGQLSGSSSSDTDILYKFIQSPTLVARIDDQLDLRAMWSAPGGAWTNAGDDPIYAYHPPGTIEDLTDYWDRMVGIYSDSGTGLIDLEVQAFTPEDAQAVAQAIYDESARMINELSAIAREDATRYAREELTTAEERLAVARTAMTRFRNRTQIVDPGASMQSQMGILSELQAQLAQTLVDLDILRQSIQGSDPRITQAERRVEVIEARISEEQRKLGMGDVAEDTPHGAAFADLVGEYERLTVEQEFASQAYTAALAAYDSAQAEARRQTRYLAAHVRPTLPEAPTYPRRLQTLGLVALFCALGWALLVLVGYSLRDRR